MVNMGIAATINLFEPEESTRCNQSYIKPHELCKYAIDRHYVHGDLLFETDRFLLCNDGSSRSANSI